MRPRRWASSPIITQVASPRRQSLHACGTNICIWRGVFLSNNGTTLMWHKHMYMERWVDDAYVCYTTLQANDGDSCMHACIVYALKLKVSESHHDLYYDNTNQMKNPPW